MSFDRDLQQAAASPDSGDVEEEEGGVPLDLAAIVDIVKFVLSAPLRHKLVTVFTFIAVLGLTKLLLWVLPRTYHVESTLLAQKTETIGALALAERSTPADEDAPTKLVTQTVLRRDNLIALIERTNLQKKWKESRSPALQLKDAIMAKLGRAPSPADEFEALVNMLESRITVSMTTEWTGEGSLTFGVDWPDAETAYRLTNAVQQSFLEARHVSEIDKFTEAISILQARADQTRKDVDATALKIEEASSAAPAPAASDTSAARAETTRRARPAPTVPPAEEDIAASAASQAAASKIKATWEGKKSAIRDLEDIRKRRINDLQAKLVEQRATYAESHPLIIDTKRALAMAMEESPQVAQLRAEESELRAQYRELTGSEPDAPSAGLSQLLQRGPSGERLSTVARGRRSVAAAAAPDEGDDRAMEFLRAQLRLQMQNYDRLIERIDAVRMELDTAEVAFKYRYSLIRPAQMPTAPIKPKVTLINIAGVICAFVFALLAALVADFVEGRILRRWQVERMLGVPVLGELQLKP